jgi:hypothetical protein
MNESSDFRGEQLNFDTVVNRNMMQFCGVSEDSTQLSAE